MIRDLWIPLVFAAAVLAILAVRFVAHMAPVVQLVGYVGNPETLQQEYLQFEGKPLPNAAAAQEFQYASSLAGKGQFGNATALLEALSKRCAVPVVFYDLALLYAQMNDHNKAVNAFRETLARDPNYLPVRNSLASLRGFEPHSADPITSESEPNDTCVAANLVSRDIDVVGEISNADDKDCFRFIAPPSPRDVVRIEIKSQSISLAPRITIYNVSGQPTGEALETADAGAGLSLLIAPPPNTTSFVEVSGNHRSFGAYALRITGTHAFDDFEPNDDLASAHRVPVGKELAANIMWNDDKDFYSFVADQGGKMTVTVEASGKLLPALVLYGPDRQPIQFAAGAAESGGKIVRTIDAQETQGYYFQVWGQSGTTGEYKFSVKYQP